MSVSAAERRAIASALGGEAELYGEGAVSDLTRLPEETVAVARALPEALILPFLRLVTTPSEHRFLPWFVEEVVIGGRPPATWAIAGALAPSLSLAELARLPVAKQLGAVPQGGGRWVRLPPDYNQWARGDETAGAPAVWREDLGHHWRAPVGVIRVILPLERTAPENHPVLTARRWVASRLAFALERGVRLADLEPLSYDARVALHALERERSRMPAEQAAGEVPGFRGPDAWFEPS